MHQTGNPCAHNSLYLAISIAGTLAVTCSLGKAYLASLRLRGAVSRSPIQWDTHSVHAETPTASTQLYVMDTALGVQNTLGPGRRSVVWVQGCSLHCPGCIVPESWRFGGGRQVDPRMLAEELLADDPSAGLTVSGGEPTDQPEAVAALLAAARVMGRTTWVYTGRALAELKADPRPAMGELLAGTDVLVDGAFDLGQAAALGYRGSANQRVLRLTDGISEADAEGGEPGKVEITLSGEGFLTVVGVPAPGFLPALQEGLAARGVSIHPRHRW